MAGTRAAVHSGAAGGNPRWSGLGHQRAAPDCGAANMAPGLESQAAPTEQRPAGGLSNGDVLCYRSGATGVRARCPWLGRPAAARSPGFRGRRASLGLPGSGTLRPDPWLGVGRFSGSGPGVVSAKGSADDTTVFKSSRPPAAPQTQASGTLPR